GDAYIARSTNAGATWTPTKVVDSTRYYFAFDGDVLPNGTIVFSQASISYTGPGSAPEGQVQYHAIRSTNNGASWTNVVVDSREIGTACEADGCYADYYLGHAVVSADANGNLVYLHDGAATAGGAQTVYAQRSTDGGATWTARVALSTTGVNSSFPAIESRGSGDVRAYYMQADGGHDAWNVWYRTSTDGGATWSAPVKISDVTGGTNYKTPAGFKEPYGDYGEIAITNSGKTIAIWGEGDSYTGPGGTWYNRQT
ncbi:MAG TPA: sialidase family protein, partial [Actinomycetota bacterium]|nr:sialidase family protein [Actinomycetota bacterium]